MSGKGKHKRGARGSIEEENSITKKKNMETTEGESKFEDSATSEGSCEQNEEKEISLEEIMKLLQNVELPFKKCVQKAGVWWTKQGS